MAKVTGVKGVNETLGKIADNIKSGAKMGVKAALLSIKAEAQIRTPVDTGNLRSSASVTMTREDKSVVRGSVYYTPTYAPPVHEMTSSAHTVGEAKFLSNAVESQRGNIMKILKTYMRLRK
jgi:hypothetical protein